MRLIGFLLGSRKPLGWFNQLVQKLRARHLYRLSFLQLCKNSKMTEEGPLVSLYIKTVLT